MAKKTVQNTRTAERRTDAPVPEPMADLFDPLEKLQRMQATAPEIEQLACEFIARGEPIRDKLNRLLRERSGNWTAVLYVIAPQISADTWNRFLQGKRNYYGDSLTPNACGFAEFARMVTAARQENQRQFDAVADRLRTLPEVTDAMRMNMPVYCYCLLSESYRDLIPEYRRRADEILRTAHMQLTQHTNWDFQVARRELDPVTAAAVYYWIDPFGCPTDIDPETGLLRSFGERSLAKSVSLSEAKEPALPEVPTGQCQVDRDEAKPPKNEPPVAVEVREIKPATATRPIEDPSPCRSITDWCTVFGWAREKMTKQLAAWATEDPPRAEKFAHASWRVCRSLLDLQQKQLVDSAAAEQLERRNPKARKRP